MDLGLLRQAVCMFLLTLPISIISISSGSTHQEVILVDTNITMDQQGASLLVPCSNPPLDLQEASFQVQTFLDRMGAAHPEQRSSKHA